MTKKIKISDWLLTAYDKNDKVLEAEIIKDRTEQEAEKEFKPDWNTDDWTLMDMKVEVKRFMIEHGSTHKGAKDFEGFSGGLSAESECLINVGYIWVDKFNKWVNKNNSSYDLRDEVVLEYIREKYCG